MADEIRDNDVHRRKLRILSQYEIIKLLNAGYKQAEEALRSFLRLGQDAQRRVNDGEKKTNRASDRQD